MYELSIKDNISTAHFLRNYKGKCANLHGHTHVVEVTILGEKLDKAGMVADFVVLKKTLSEILTKIDHVCLNDIQFFKENNPTSENIARYIYQKYSESIKPIKVKQVQVWESDSSSVIYYE